MPHRVGQHFGDYRVVRFIKSGGFGEVYEAEHVRRKTPAAVKVLNMRLTGHSLKSFLKEARAIRLRHPHILEMLDFDAEGDTPFLVMVYVPRGSLRDCYPPGTKLPLETMVSYIKQVAEALQFAHDEGIIHRDIKPENMLLEQGDSVLLADFGLSVVAHTTMSQQLEDIVGTVSYMAPEQIQQMPRRESDQYALGVVAYEWLTGCCPFRGSPIEVISQHLAASPPPLLAQAPGIPLPVEEVVLKALAKDPKERFASVRDFAQALEAALQPERVPGAMSGMDLVDENWLPDWLKASS
jgi:eukaryotic-like serine/threonine-protein kinase